jgi:hypothetical protein
LTERKREFLAALCKLYDERMEPVHYEDVARELGVSKWTAYDVLRSLAAEGLVAVEYTLNRRARTPGRSMVVFRPDTCREDLHSSLARHCGRSPFDEELDGIKNYLVACLGALGDPTSQGIWQGFMEKLDRATGPAAFCGYMAVLLVACTRLLGGNGLDALGRLVEAGADAHSALVVFSGAIIGMFVSHPCLPGDVTGKIAGYMRRFQNQVDNLSGRERCLLLEFVREILGRTCRSGRSPSGS